MNKSESIIELSKAMVKFQGRVKTIKATEENPHFRHKYAGLGSIWDEIRIPLSECGLAVIQSPEVDGNTITVVTTLMHESGQYIENSLKMTAVDNRPQSVGSCITYGRRYSLTAILGLSSEEDDDGNAASRNPETSSQQKAKNQKPQAPEQNQGEKPVQTISDNFLQMCVNEIKSFKAAGVTPGEIRAEIFAITKKDTMINYMAKEDLDMLMKNLKATAEKKIEEAEKKASGKVEVMGAAPPAMSEFGKGR